VTTVDIIDGSGKKSGSVDLPAEIFDVQVNIPLIHQVVVAQQAAARQGTHSTKTRAEVSGGGRKPYRQKGTGRARQGSIRAPQYAGGGIVHGPTPHGYDQRTPKKMKAAALRGALSDRARDGRVHVIEGFGDADKPSTKAALAVLAQVTDRPRVLVVLQRGDDTTWLSLRNIDTIHVLNVDQLNTYDVLLSDDVVFTKGAYDVFVAGPATGKSVKAVATSSEVEPQPEVVEETKPKAAKKTAAKKAAATVVADDTEAPAEVVVETDAEPAAEAPQADAEPKAAKKATAKKAPAKKAAAKKTAAKKTAEPAADDAGADEAAADEDAT
jgi:large subunit ribosomal protein L4